MQPLWAGQTGRASFLTGMLGNVREKLARKAGAVGLTTSMLVLAACSTTSQQTVAPPPPPPTEQTKPTEVKPSEPHRIAILAPLTGSNAPVGISLANAASLALVDTNTQGMRLSSYDTAALGATGAVNRAIADGAQLILGPLLAADVTAAKAVAQAKGITMLTFSNDSGVAGGPAYVLGFQPAQSVDRVIDYAAARGAKRFAALVPDGVYGRRTSVAFTRAVTDSKGQVVALQNFARSPSALAPAARKVTNYDARQKAAAAGEANALGFEALLVADSGAIAAAFAPHLTKFGAPKGQYLLMGTELWDTEPGLGKSPALQGAVFAAVPDQRFQSMARRYQARFGGTPSRLASLSYDAMLLAISAAGNSWKPGTPFPAQILSDPQGFAGVDGIFRFKGNVAERGLEVQQVTPTGFSTVSPAPAAFEKK